MKKIIGLIVLIVLASTMMPKGAFADINQTLSGLVQSRQAASFDSASYILDSFKSTGAMPSGYVIHNWSQINSEFVPLKPLTQMAQTYAQPLGLTGIKTYTHEDLSETYCRLLGINQNGASVSVTLASLDSGNDKNSTILTIHEEAYGHKVENLTEDVNKVLKMLASYAIPPQISACLEGTVSARMSGVHQCRLITKALQVVRAQRIEGVESDLVDSISAYSPLAPSFIVTNGRKMNLQVAVHYDSYHHRTNVVVGTPIITVTY